MRVYVSRKLNIKFHIPGDREQVRAVLLWIITVLTVAALALGSVCAVMYFSVRRFTVEAGQISSAAELTGDESAYFDERFDLNNLNVPGVYYVDIYTDSGSFEARLQIEDKKAPMVSVKDIQCAVNGDLPIPEDFIDTVFESGSFKGEYITPLPEIKAMGTYSAQIRFTDQWGNKTEIFDVRVSIVVDNEPPQISAPLIIETEIGQSIDYEACIVLSDNCIGKLRYTVDESLVDYSAVGTYDVVITAFDAVNNRIEKAVKVRVVEPVEVTLSETEAAS